MNEIVHLLKSFIHSETEIFDGFYFDIIRTLHKASSEIFNTYHPSSQLNNVESLNTDDFLLKLVGEHLNHSEQLKKWETNGCPCYDGISSKRSSEWNETSFELKYLRVATKLLSDYIISITQTNEDNKGFGTFLSTSKFQIMWLLLLIEKRKNMKDLKSLEIKACMSADTIWLSIYSDQSFNHNNNTNNSNKLDVGSWNEQTIDYSGTEWILNPLSGKSVDLSSLLEYQNSLFNNDIGNHCNTIAHESLLLQKQLPLMNSSLRTSRSRLPLLDLKSLLAVILQQFILDLFIFSDCHKTRQQLKDINEIFTFSLHLVGISSTTDINNSLLPSFTLSLIPLLIEGFYLENIEYQQQVSSTSTTMALLINYFKSMTAVNHNNISALTFQTPVDIYDLILTLQPLSYISLYIMGRYYYCHGHVDKAVGYFNQLLDYFEQKRQVAIIIQYIIIDR